MLTHYGKKLPQWILQGDDLAQRSQHLTENLMQVAARLVAHNKAGHKLPMVMASTIAGQALAKAHRSAVVDLLNSDSKLNVIGIDSVVPAGPQTGGTGAAPDKKNEEPTSALRLLSIAATDDLIARIIRTLQDTQNNARLISSIESMEPFEVRCEAYNPENKVYCVRLIDYRDRHRNQLARALFRKQCAATGATICKATRYSSDMRLYRISLDSAADMEAVRGFEGVFSIEQAFPLPPGMDAFDDIFIPTVKQPKSGGACPAPAPSLLRTMI